MYSVFKRAAKKNKTKDDFLNVFNDKIQLTEFLDYCRQKRCAEYMLFYQEYRKYKRSFTKTAKCPGEKKHSHSNDFTTSTTTTGTTSTGIYLPLEIESSSKIDSRLSLKMSMSNTNVTNSTISRSARTDKVNYIESVNNENGIGSVMNTNENGDISEVKQLDENQCNTYVNIKVDDKNDLSTKESTDVRHMTKILKNINKLFDKYFGPNAEYELRINNKKSIRKVEEVIASLKEYLAKSSKEGEEVPCPDYNFENLYDDINDDIIDNLFRNVYLPFIVSPNKIVVRVKQSSKASKLKTVNSENNQFLMKI